MRVFIPLDAYPNQTASTTINNIRWSIELNTRLGRLYATVSNDADGVVVRNRLCLDGIFITKNFVFIDQDGNQDPVYDGLGSRFVLVWTDES